MQMSYMCLTWLFHGNGGVWLYHFASGPRVSDPGTSQRALSIADGAHLNAEWVRNSSSISTGGSTEQQAYEAIAEQRPHLHILFLFRANWKYIRNKSGCKGSAVGYHTSDADLNRYQREFSSFSFSYFFSLRPLCRIAFTLNFFRAIDRVRVFRCREFLRSFSTSWVYDRPSLRINWLFRFPRVSSHRRKSMTSSVVNGFSSILWCWPTKELWPSDVLIFPNRNTI